MKTTLNLATRTYVNRRALYLFYGAALAVLTLVLLLNVNLYLSSRSETIQLDERLSELERQVETERGWKVVDLSPTAQKALVEEIARANAILERDAFRWTLLLDHIEEVLPKEVLVSSIQPDYADRSVQLTGIARNVKELRRFLDNLIASPNFTDVFLLQQSRVETRSPEQGAKGGISYRMVLKGAF